MTWKWQLTMLPLFLASLSACGGESTTPSEGHRLEGVVVTAPDRVPAEGVPARVSLALSRGGEKVDIEIYSDTYIVIRRPDGSLLPGSVDYIKKGIHVLVWTTEEVYLSDPPLFTATRVEVQ